MDTNSIQQNPNPKNSSIDTNSIDQNPKNSSIDTNSVDTNPKTIDTDSIDQNPSPKTDTNSIEQNLNPNTKTLSIDNSLDAIENQLASISLHRTSEISSNSSNNSINDELYTDAPSGLPNDENNTPIGLPNDDISASTGSPLDANNNAPSGVQNDDISVLSGSKNDDDNKGLSGLPLDGDNNALSGLKNDDISAFKGLPNDGDNKELSGLKNDDISASTGLPLDDNNAVSGLPVDGDNSALSGLPNDGDKGALESGHNNDDNNGLSGLPLNDGDNNVAIGSEDRVLSQSSLGERGSSGGYGGERESSGGSTSGIEGGDEISEVGGDGSGEPEPAVWVPGKRHVHEDDASVSWRKRKKHFFILSHSGKPIYSRYGDEHKLAGFSATLQAIVSFVEDGKDRIQLVRAGKHQVVFLVKGPIYLVCISCTEEPYESLRGQLELIYGQMIVILTQSVNRCFEKNSKFDMTPLLGGTDVVFSSLIHSFSWNPATFLHAYTCLPLAYATRQAAGAILQDVADSGVLFAILMCKHKVVSLVGAEKASLHPDDMLLLSNFVMSSESFRTSESFSPICLPRYNPMAFLYAYVQYLDADTYLMLLTTSSNAFYHLKECRMLIENVLLKSNVLSEVQRSMLDGGMHVEDVPLDTSSRSSSPQFGQPKLLTDSLDRYSEGFVGVGGPSGLWHFIYRSIYLNQYVSSEFSSPINSSRQQKRLYRAYQNLFSSMHEKDSGPHKTQFRRDEHFVLLCWVTPDFELYAAFDPLADKALAIKTCNRVCQWVKDVENEIFFLGASPFSW